MIGRTLSHFRIVDKIGEGGMGVVYRARDESLGRQVALKVLHTEFITDDERRQRFLREARTAGALAHPNIAMVHEVGEQDNVIFIAMELVEGRTLGQLIAERVPPIEECLRLAIEIAEGLGRAHASSIAHRDLKPDNVRIAHDGRVKILDFGLAKLYHDPKAPLSSDSSALQTISAAVTRDHHILGTVAYMSPEQARGLEVDARSDVFSLGIVLYELVTGKRPFGGETITDTLSAILRDPAPPIARFNPQVPVELERILQRCLEKKPEERYPDAAALLEDLRRLKRVTDSQPVPLVRDDAGARKRPRWWRPWPVVATLGALVLGALVVPPVLRPLLAGKQPILAVLPFENLQQVNDPDRLGQILQELIITDLSELESLKVLSSQRLFDAQKQFGRDARTTIDRDLAARVVKRAGASLMLTGTLSQLGSTWILTTQLIDVDDGSVLESERIDGADLYGMVDDLTSVVRRDLGLDAQSDVAVKERTSSSLEAYNAYLQGVEDLNALSFDAAAGQLQRAVELDPAFGRAHYKLAIARWWGRSLDGYEFGSPAASPGQALRTLLQDPVKLTRKDRLLIEAFLTLVEQRYAEARPLFDELVRLYPDEKEAWYGLGEAHFHDGATAEERDRALPPLRRAVELDPGFSLAFYHVVDQHIRNRRLDEGLAELRRFVEADPHNGSWHQELARLALVRGEEAQIDAVIEGALRNIERTGAQRALLASVAKESLRQSDPDRATKLLARALAIETSALEDRIHLGLAEAAFLREDFAAVERHARHALEVAPRSVPALRVLFASFDRRQRFAEAIREARRLVADEPDLEAAYGHWAAAAIRSGNRREIDAALEAVSGRIASAKNQRDTARLLGRHVAEAYALGGDFVSAERFVAPWRESLANPPTVDDVPVLIGLGEIALELGRPAEAEGWFGKAAARAPGSGDAALGLARSRVEQGRAAEAVENVDRVCKITASEPWSMAKLAGIYLLAGRKDAAAEVIDRATRGFVRPSDPWVFGRDLAAGYAAVGRYDDALAEIRKAAAEPHRPGSVGVDQLLVALLMRQGRIDDARTALERALALHPTDEVLRRQRPALSLLGGDAAGAERGVRAELERGPVHTELYTLLALSLAEQQRFREAAEVARTAFARDPDRQGHAVLAWTLVAGDLDVAEGLELARKARELPTSPFDAARTLAFVPSPEHCIGLAYLKQDRLGEAVDELQRAAGLRPDRGAIREDLERASLRFASKRS